MRVKLLIQLAFTLLFASVVSGQAPAEESVDRVFHFAHVETPQGLQEIVTVLRTVAEIQRIFLCNAPRSVALRGTADQMAVAEWLFNALDKPASGQSLARLGQDSGMHEYRVLGNSDDVVRVFYLTHTDTVQGLQEIATTIRTIADIQRIFVCNASRALALRGTVDQVARSTRLIEEMDKPGAQ